ncbi:MAG: T9SS type A sorting domain-containing protein [Dysgonamonadaceae bacterium]|nr:T9SS type A sorting domain-containing protein [Dysgonamonadaceae bacterium]
MKKIIFLALFVCLFTFGANAQYNVFDGIAGQHGDIALGDVDNDGDLDVLLAGETRDNSHVYSGGLYINDGQGNFTYKDCPVMPGFRASLDFGDIDGDGDLDILFSGHKNNGIPEANARGIALNDGQGNFTIAGVDDYPHLEMLSPTVLFADFNNDGLLDYLNAPMDEQTHWDWELGSNVAYSGSWTFYFQQPDGSFVADNTQFQNYFRDPVITAGDFDNDGDVDLFYQGYIPPASAVNETFPDLYPGRWATVLFANDGTGHFSVGYDFANSGLGSCDWGDLDGNGWLDVIFVGDGFYMIPDNMEALHNRICLNHNEYFTELPALDRAGQFSMQGADVLQDFDNDGDVDVLFGGWNADPGVELQKTYVYDNIHSGGDFTYETSLSRNDYLTDSYIPGMSEQDFECADLNGDNVVDFVYMGFKGVNSFSTDVWGDNVNIAAWTPGLTGTAYAKLNAPRNLSAIKTAAGDKWKVTFSWNEPDNIGAKKSVTYNLALKNATTGKWLYYPNAIVGGAKDGFRQVNRMGNMYLNKQWTLTLPEGNYEWTVQAIDPARLGGSFAPVQSLAVQSGIGELSPDGLKIASSNGNLVVTDNNAALLNLKVYTPAGQKVLETPFSGRFSAPLQKGVYIVKIEGPQGSKIEKTVVK